MSNLESIGFPDNIKTNCVMEQNRHIIKSIIITAILLLSTSHVFAQNYIRIHNLQGQMTHEYLFEDVDSIVVAEHDPNDMTYWDWHLYASGTMTETWWQSSGQRDLYYHDMGNGEWYCYITNCFGVYDDAEPINFYFKWNRRTNLIRVPNQFTGFSYLAYGQLFVGDIASAYIDFFGKSDYTPDRFFNNGYEQSYYDGYGTFYFMNCFYVEEGWFTRDNVDTFVIHQTYTVKSSVREKAPIAVPQRKGEGILKKPHEKAAQEDRKGVLKEDTAPD